jgi:Kinesin motor domain
VRPANIDVQQEVLKDFVLQRTAVHLVPDEPQIMIGKDESNQKSFTFDYVYGPHSSQATIYADLAAPLVDQFLQGFNATILAYGQTFSGKTYTMGSTDTPESFPSEQGIIPRVFQYILENLPENSSMQNIVKVSFLEIYQEQVKSDN